MAPNRRIYYAIQKAGIAPLGSTTYTSIRGLQSLGLNTTFNLDQVFEMGIAPIYENVEGIPNIEASMQKVLDGYCPIYLLATQGASAANLIARANAPACSLILAIYNDQQLAASGTAVTAVTMSGMYISSVAYRVSIDGNATEDVSMVGNNKVWTTANPTINDSPTIYGGIATGNDQPLSITGSGGVNRREDVLFGPAVNRSRLPTQVVGGSGYLSQAADGSYPIHIRNLGVNVNMGREDIFEIGRKGVFYKYVRLPVEVTTEIGVSAVSGDMINALEEGSVSTGGCGRYNLIDEPFVLRMCEGLVVDCGTKNKLASVGYNGGGTDGGNAEISYTYRNFNDFSVHHPKDPNAGTAAFVPTGGWS